MFELLEKFEFGTKQYRAMIKVELRRLWQQCFYALEFYEILLVLHVLSLWILFSAREV